MKHQSLSNSKVLNFSPKALCSYLHTNSEVGFKNNKKDSFGFHTNDCFYRNCYFDHKFKEWLFCKLKIMLKEYITFYNNTRQTSNLVTLITLSKVRHFESTYYTWYYLIIFINLIKVRKLHADLLKLFLKIYIYKFIWQKLFVIMFLFYILVNMIVILTI